MSESHSQQLDMFTPITALNSSQADLLGFDKIRQTPVVEKDPYAPSERFIYHFKPEWEKFFEKGDDSIIRWAQYYHSRNKNNLSTSNRVWGVIFHLLSVLVTFISRIENISAISLFVICLGFDYLGRWFTLVGITVSLTAQFPKRFLFRRRPFMTNRALRSGKLDTSSFPSRAVTCAVVYAFTGIIAYNYQNEVAYHKADAGIGVAGSIFLILFAFLASSFARIHLGAHYPSDCYGGLVQGLFVCLVSWLLFKIPNIFGCPSCYDNTCYPTDPNHMMSHTTFSPQNIGVSIIVTVIVGVLLILSNCPPLVFWNKSAPIFGTFCACMVAEILMVCPTNHSKGLIAQDYDQLSFLNYFYAILVAAAYLALSGLAAKVNKITRKFTLIKSLTCNVCVYLFFVIGFLALVVEVRLSTQ